MQPDISLRKDAIELSKVLNLIVQGLEQYQGSAYTRQMARMLAPVVAEYDAAVFTSRSRDAAASALAVLKEYMHNVNGAATKGDLNFVADSVLNQYWNLQSIFQESKYRGVSL
jgi:hypothetical protein